MFVADEKIKPHPEGNVRDLTGEPLDHSQQLLHFHAFTKMSFNDHVYFKTQNAKE